MNAFIRAEVVDRLDALHLHKTEEGTLHCFLVVAPRNIAEVGGCPGFDEADDNFCTADWLLVAGLPEPPIIHDMAGVLIDLN